jgi:hypothetical protein
MGLFDDPLGTIFDVAEEGVNTLTSGIETLADVTAGLAYGELPSSSQVNQLISTGLTVAEIASVTGCAEVAIQALLED